MSHADSLLRLASSGATLLVAVLVAAPLGAVATAQAATNDERAVDFARDVRPILARRCFHCHGPDKAEGGLRLHERESALAELDSTSHAIVPRDVESSAIVYRVSSTEEYERMPPEGKPLSAAEIDLIRRWIADGAEWQAHWAFRAPQPQTPPAVGNQAWVRTPVDAFVLAKLEAAGLEPAMPADRVTLARRLYYDLTGLPPAPEEVDAFVADTSADAYERLVDRLLESPRYGERQARAWLDLVRYAETNSFERDGAKPNAWRYRDYVIRSFNDDKPYDQFIREQLAGDELRQPTTESIVATGYYRLGVWDDEPADERQARYDELDDLVSTTSQVFLGLTINCARCHDHKIDPIPQADYYRLLAFFQPLRPYGTRADQLSWNQTDISPAAIAAAHQAADERRRALRDKLEAIEARGIRRMPAEDQRASEGPERKELLKEKLCEYLVDVEWEAHQAHSADLAALDKEQARLPRRDSALSVHMADEHEETFILVRGNPHTPGDRVEPQFPELLGGSKPDVADSSQASSPRSSASGLRLALADWIASADNLLTARVMANRVWQHHFGRGIVRSSNNFGQLGDLPTHPELLDWLAAELVRGGWRLKPLHRTILLSSAYRMSSTSNAAALNDDPTNNLFWRFDMRRLSAEEIRDSVLAVSGRLNDAMFGPSIYAPISAEVMAGQSRPGYGWGESSLADQSRRSIYIHVKRSLVTPILADFDYPETDTSCAVRFATTQPAQALGMIHGAFLHDQAAALAERLVRETGHDRQAQVHRAFRLALSREPSEQDVARGLELRRTLEFREGLSEDEALRYFCLMVLNLNEFVYLD